MNDKGAPLFRLTETKDLYERHLESKGLTRKTKRFSAAFAVVFGVKTENKTQRVTVEDKSVRATHLLTPADCQRSKQ
jgi:hypothetical protein